MNRNPHWPYANAAEKAAHERFRAAERRRCDAMVAKLSAQMDRQAEWRARNPGFAEDFDRRHPVRFTEAVPTPIGNLMKDAA